MAARKKLTSPWVHLAFWVGVSVLFFLCVFALKAMLLPFVLGIAVAYLLNPVVNSLGNVGFNRSAASMMILGGFLILILAFLGILTPILMKEFKAFSQDLPDYIDAFWKLAAPYTSMIEQYIGGANEQSLHEVLKNNSASATQAMKVVFDYMASSGQAVIDFISVALLMPVVAYFMMAEWPRITKWVHDLMPRHSEEAITDLLRQIDLKISSFVRGQISVAVILGIAYAICLSLAGLKYGFLIGLMSGVLSIIPMVGSALGLVVSICVAWFQSGGDLTFVLVIGGIFVTGQVIEGNFLTPKLVGDSVGLHPLWVFFALMAGGSLLGIVGMLVAVPVAATIGVLLSFAIHKYKNSAYYLDESQNKKETKTRKPKAVKKAAKKQDAKS
ncbi:MAG: AI-2E family transporter [Alphaproteobacteria bacterium]|nr:AI-2E family transporter [Alphaproteobacteria bacterium]